MRYYCIHTWIKQGNGKFVDRHSKSYTLNVLDLYRSFRDTRDDMHHGLIDDTHHGLIDDTAKLSFLEIMLRVPLSLH